jgi:hypothetical protein
VLLYPRRNDASEVLIMDIFRITIYGWVITDSPTQGTGSGSLCDLVYFTSEKPSVSDIFSIIEGAGYKMVAKGVYDENGHQLYTTDPYTGKRKRIIEADRIQVEDWSSHLKVGTEQVPSPNFEQNPPTDRYNYPYSGGA